MGVVYEAEQISLGRRVALKVLPGPVSGDPMVQERFRREARAAARLHHTNIVPIYEVGQDGDVCFYAMQFIQGLGLDQVIAELRQLRDRAGFRPRSKRSPGPVAPAPRWAPGQGIGAPTLGEGVVVSAVLRSILAGRFDPGGPSLEPGRPRHRCWPGPSPGPATAGTGREVERPDSTRPDASRDRECELG